MPLLSVQAGGWVALVGSGQSWANSPGIPTAQLCNTSRLPARMVWAGQNCFMYTGQLYSTVTEELALTSMGYRYLTYRYLFNLLPSQQPT